MNPALPLLESLLRARIEVLNVQRVRHAPGYAIRETIVPTPRLLLAIGGEARYRIEDATLTFRRGSMLLVPAAMRRGWAASGPARQRFELVWLEFRPAERMGVLPPYFLANGCDVALEAAAFDRLHRLQVLNDPLHTLSAEGEAKALLARFLSRAQAGTGPAKHAGRTSGDRAVLEALAWLGANFSEPKALDGLPERVGLSPNHFRLLFKQHFGLSAQRYLTTLRMRAARALLQESARPIKEIAAATGYRDPLFFSRHYRTFWKRMPSQDRAFNP